MKKGVVLIVVLWVVAIFALLGASLAYRCRIYLRLVRYNYGEIENFYQAKQALDQAILVLIDDNYNYDTLADDWNKIDYTRREDIDVAVAVSDESGRVNINKAAKEMLALLPGITEETQKDIIANRPYLRKEELLYLESVTKEMYYGRPEVNILGLKDLITVYSDGKININTAAKEVLQSIPGMDEAALEAILNFRSVNTFKDSNSLLNDLINLGVSSETASKIINLLTVSSNVYKIKTSALHKRYAISCQIAAVVQRAAKQIKIISWEEL